MTSQLFNVNKQVNTYFILSFVLLINAIAAHVLRRVPFQQDECPHPHSMCTPLALVCFNAHDIFNKNTNNIYVCTLGHSKS
jgi:hypothetical protein